MNGTRRVSLIMLLLGLAGAALLVFLVMRHDVGAIAAAVAAAGWGVAAVVAFHLVPLFFDVLDWHVLFPPKHRPRWRSLLWMRWMGESVSALLPVAQVGGDLLRIRLAARESTPVIAMASVVLTITVSIATQLVFTLSGAALLALHHGNGKLVAPALLGTLLATIVVVLFYAVQRFGMFRLVRGLIARLEKMVGGGWDGLAAHGEALDETVRELYGRRMALLASAFWTMCVWATGAVEVWIALRALGSSAGYVDAYILESMSQGIRSVMFLVPGAIGVQEGGYVVVGAALGIPGEMALALAMIRRVRELAFSVPGLIAWQWLEGRRWWTSPADSAAARKAS